jgi:hypothetical protein
MPHIVLVFSSCLEWMPHAETPVGAAFNNAYEVWLVPLPLWQAISRHDGLEKRGQTRLLKASDQIRGKKVLPKGA